MNLEYQKKMQPLMMMKNLIFKFLVAAENGEIKDIQNPIYY
ncbi:hypothetical protein V2647_03210 [Tenacibaculum maritimum]